MQNSLDNRGEDQKREPMQVAAVHPGGSQVVNAARTLLTYLADKGIGVVNEFWELLKDFALLSIGPFKNISETNSLKLGQRLARLGASYESEFSLQIKPGSCGSFEGLFREAISAVNSQHGGEGKPEFKIVCGSEEVLKILEKHGACSVTCGDFRSIITSPLASRGGWGSKDMREEPATLLDSNGLRTADLGSLILVAALYRKANGYPEDRLNIGTRSDPGDFFDGNYIRFESQYEGDGTVFLKTNCDGIFISKSCDTEYLSAVIGRF